MPDILAVATRPNNGTHSVETRWSNVTPADTMLVYELPASFGLQGAVQLIGNIGGATVTFQKSLDGVNFVSLEDIGNVPISFTGGGVREYSTACRYVRPQVAGGSGYNFTLILCMRAR